MCRNGLVQDDDLRLSHMRIERQDQAPAALVENADEQLLRAFHRLFEEQAGGLHEKVEDSLLRAAYRFCHCNQVHTASLLGLSRNVTRARLIAIGELVVNRRRPEPAARPNRAVRLSI